MHTVGVRADLGVVSLCPFYAKYAKEGEKNLKGKRKAKRIQLIQVKIEKKAKNT